MTATIRAIGARPRCGPPAQAGGRIPAERDVADRLILLAAALAVPTLQLLAGFLRPRVDRRQCSAPGCSDAEKQVF
jgi:predicted RNA-binding Zn ribbon-like protein